MQRSVKRWTMRLLKAGVGLVVVLLVALVTAVAVLDDDDYRGALIWATETYLDARLSIDGELSIDLGPTLALQAQGLKLRTNDGLFSASITDLGTQLQLRHLLSKTLWLDSLTVVGARFDIYHPPEETDPRRPEGRRGLRNLIVQQARLLEVALNYHDADDALQELQIDRLLIEDSLNEGPIVIDGSGAFQRRQIVMAGTLGSREQLLQGHAPFPVDLRLGSEGLSVGLAGSIADPIRGQGIDLQMRAEAPDLAASLALLGKPAPSLGELRAEATIQGDYDAVQLTQLALSLRRNDEIDILVTGGIANLPAMAGVDLAISGTIGDSEAWQWLTSDRLPGFDRGAFSGTVSDQADALQITDLKLETSSQTGVSLVVEGIAGIVPGTTPLTEPDIDLGLRLSAPSHAALQPLVEHGLPELGPIELSARLFGPVPRIEFEALDVTVGRKAQHRYRLENGHGRLDLREDPVLRQASIPMTLTTPEPAGLSRLFGVDLPPLGPAEAKGTWRVDGATVKLEHVDSTFQLGGGATHRLAGSLMHRVGESTTADLRFDLDTDHLLALWTEDKPGELGRVAGSIALRGGKAGWQARRFELASTETELFDIAVVGTGEPPASDRPQEMAVRLEIDDPTKLLSTAGFQPLPLAPIEVRGTLTAYRGEYRYLGDLRVGASTSRLDLAASLQDDRPMIRGEFTTPRLALADIGLSVDAVQATTPAKTGKDTDAAAPEAGGPSRPLFSRKPLDLAWLQRLDLDLLVRIDELRGVELAIDDIQSRISLDSGILRLSQADFRYLGGEASGEYELDARSTPRLKVDARADDLKLSDILGEFLSDTFEGGILDLDLKFEGHGRSLHDMVSGANGELDIAFEKTGIPSAYVEFLSADVFGWTLGKTALSDGNSFIDCGVIGLDIDTGLVESHALLAEGPELSLSGTIRLDLQAETLDLVVLPIQKKSVSVFDNATPVKLSGNLRDPQVEAIPAKAAAQRIGPLVLLPQVFIPLEAVSQVRRLLSRRTSSDSSPGCTQVLGRSVGEGFAFEGAELPATDAD